MSRHVDTGSTDQTIVFWAFDSLGAAVEVTTSDTVSYRVDNNGREGTPVSMSLVARSVAGTHRDNAITYKGNGKHEVDLPDAAIVAGEVTLEVTKSGVTTVYVEKLEVSAPVATAAELAKVPKVGQTHRFTQVANNSGAKTADVSISVIP